jgi:hypothetical protein
MQSLALATLGLLFLTIACGGVGSSSGSSNTTSNTPTTPAATVAVTVSPASPTVLANSTQQFAATVTGSSNTAVNWAVVEANGGKIDGNGLYTAPTSQGGPYHVTATSQADSTKSAQAAIMVAVVGVTINQSSPVSLYVNATEQFTATVTGYTDTVVNWKADAGTIDSTGKYTAPLTAGTYHVTATSHADPTKSATAAVQVTVPQPVFSSQPGTTATSGTAYTYTVAVTDPAQTAVTLSLTTAPTGATLKTNTISWTPTAAQVRTANTFTVTAKTAAGGTNTQTWSVSVPGAVTGSYIDTFWDVNGGSSPASNDLTAPGWSFAALIPQADGSVQTINGTGATNGTFSIPGVPGGYYWLRITNPHGDISSVTPDQTGTTELYWTNSSTFDYGRDYVGRVPSAQVSTNVAFALTGLDAWASGNQLQVLSPNANSTFNPTASPATGATAFTDSETLTVNPIDPTQGDTSYVLQYEATNAALPSGFTGQVLGPALSLPALTISGAGPNNVTGLMGPPLTSATSSFDFNLLGSQWASMFNNVGPASVMQPSNFFEAVITVQPFISNKASFNDGFFFAKLLNLSSGVSTDQDLGAMSYNNPFPGSWAPVFASYQEAFANLPLTSGVTAFRMSAEYRTLTIPSATAGIAPLMSAVVNPTIKTGSTTAPLFSPGTLNKGPVTVSWTAPTGLPAFGYDVQIWQLGATATYVADLFTGTTSVTIPTNLLTSGKTYAFLIEAFADSRGNMASSPWHQGYPQAFVWSISAPVAVP